MKKFFLLLLLSIASFAQRPALPVGISSAMTPQSNIDILRQEGQHLVGPIGSGVYSGVASVINSNIIQGSASEVGGFNLYIRKIIINSTKDAKLQVVFNQAVGLGSTIGGVTYPVYVRAGETYELTIDALVSWGSNIYLYAESFGDPSGNAYVTFSHESFKTFQTVDVFSPYSLLGIGDSIMKGTGTSYLKTNPYLSHFARLFKYYRDLGYDIKGVNKGIPGATIEDIVSLVRCQYYDIKKPDIILFSIGTNVSPSNTSFTNSLKEILDYFQARYPKAKKLICGPITRLDIKELNLVDYRAIMQAEVNSRNDASMYYLDLSQSFDASNPIYGLIPGDYNTGVGGEVHANDLGNQEIFNFVKAFCITHSIYPN